MRYLLVAFTVSCFVVGAGGTSGQPDQQQDQLDLILQVDLQARYGLDTMDPKERSNVARLLEDMSRLYERRNPLERSAAKFVRLKGWEEVDVIGTRRLKLNEWDFEKEYLVVSDGLSTYFLDPFPYVAPGTYFGKLDFGSAEIIDSDGRTLDFFVVEVR